MVMRTLGWFLTIAVFHTLLVCAEPAPGDVYREYLWWNEDGDAGGSVRVGGKLGEEYPDRGSHHGYINSAIELSDDFDLDGATKAEVVLEKILCHDGTQGLAIQVNGNDWLPVPVPNTIPYPQWEYQHHIYPTVAVPLSHLKKGKGNQFRLRVAAEHRWNWPQNLIYGVHFRVYYDPETKPHPMGKIDSLQDGDSIGAAVSLTTEITQSPAPIQKVDYIGFFEDLNWEGDGVYRQWHYHYFHSDLIHHIGSAVEKPYKHNWDASWLPDQREPMYVSARIVDETGLIYFSEPVGDLALKRDFSVELCKPYSIPQRWATRSGEKEQYFDIQGDLSKATAAQMAWSSWSPGYMNGIYINDQKVFDSEGPNYQYYAHRVDLKNLDALKQGQNRLKTGKTPLYDGKMVHGMEVNWPGIMVLVRYAK